MLIVSNCIVSEDIVDRCFCCPLSECKGQCCVEGDAGAPLEEEEVADLERILPQVKPYMTEKGLAAIEEQGVAVREDGFGISTPLVDDRECAFVAWGTDGTAYCAIEQAWRDGKTDFMKPVSCHLYPLRLDNYGEFVAVNYHQWDICRCAANHPDGKPLYQYLREPLVRRFGQAWYDELLEQIALQNK